MKFAPSRHRSIRYSIFIGVLAGSLFSGSGALAIELSSIASLVADNEDITLVENGTYEAGDANAGPFLGSSYFGTYTGTLSGSGATITGLTVPLFGLVAGEVKDLNLATETVHGVVGNGALASNLHSTGIVNNVTVTGKVGNEMFTYVGGLVGTSNGSINDSSVSAIVSGYSSVGGLVGESYGTITNSHATGNVTGEIIVGGLVGESYGQITGSWYTTGTVTGDQQIVGGLVGLADGEITDSYATGDVSGVDDVGGLVGFSEADITDSYATGDVIGVSDVGGLVGFSDTDGNITDSYATGDVEGESNIGGLVGYSDGEITDSHALGNVTGSGEYIGGLVGESSGYISNSYAKTGIVTGTGFEVEEHGIGGLVGYSSGYIEDSYAEGNVFGSYEVGGLVGSTGGNFLSITNSYATGDVSGVDDVGGLVGLLDEYHSITDSHATGDVTGEDNLGGLVGNALFYSSITNSHATGNVTGDENLGGLVGNTLFNTSITNSHAIGNVTGDGDLGGLVGHSGSGISYSFDTSGELSDLVDVIPGSIAVIAGGTYFKFFPDPVGWLVITNISTISNSYAEGNVSGDDNIGGLVGYQNVAASITNSYAIGDVTAAGPGFSGDVGGLVGDAGGAITNSHASGDVSGEFDAGGLVGDLQSSGSIKNSYATGNVSATGTDGDWDNGWGGLVGESSGLISNSYATGNVVADYNYGSLIGYLMLDESLDPQILNSYATGSSSSANNGVTLDGEEELFGLGGFVGCAVEDSLEDYSYSCLDSYKTFPETTPSILSVVNTVDDGEESAFEIVACKNNGLPSLSELIESYENTCVTPSGSNRERRIRDFIQTTPITEIAKTLGFVISPKFPNDASIGFIKSEKELAISKILGAQKAADRVARTSMKTGEALQISYNFDSKDPIELWVKLPDGKWILAGVINFDKNGKAVLPPKQFKVAGEYVLVLNKPSEESVKANAPLNQIGSLTVFVN